MVDLEYQFIPCRRWVKELVADGFLGELYGFSSIRPTCIYNSGAGILPRSRAWRATSPRGSGGACQVLVAISRTPGMAPAVRVPADWPLRAWRVDLQPKLGAPIRSDHFDTPTASRYHGRALNEYRWYHSDTSSPDGRQRHRSPER
jgi:hypothetical protein